VPSLVDPLQKQKEREKTMSNSSSTSPIIIDPSSFYDLIIIGAGPTALAVVSRLLEDRPAALYTDVEHARLEWLRRYGGKKLATLRTNRRGNRAVGSKGGGGGNGDDLKESPELAFDGNNTGYKGTLRGKRILVVDKHGPNWLSQWDALFKVRMTSSRLS
jgi:hypothetical protein